MFIIIISSILIINFIINLRELCLISFIIPIISFNNNLNNLNYLNYY